MMYVNSNLQRLTRGLAAALFATVGLGAPAQEAPSKEALERAIVDAISRGERADELIARWRANHGTSAQSARPLKRMEGEVLKEALAGLRGALESRRAGKDNATQLEAAVESVRAADALLTASFDDAARRLKDEKAAAEFDIRLNAARAKVRVPLDALYQLLGAVSPAEKSAPATPAAPNASAVARALSVVEEASREVAAPILRASTLPVRPANLAARAPVATPVIVPSYLATADVTPQPADSAPADEAPFSEEILAKAKALDHDYVKIFEFVRNDVKTEWYAGSQKGATGVLRAKAGNAVDQASLLIALLRASGAPARYVQGVIELPVETVAVQMGLADASLVVEALTRAGIAHQPIVQGGRVARVRMEHVWVTALVPYTNYRGVVLDTTGKTWLPLDAWFKRLEGLAAEPAMTKAGLTGGVLADAYRGADRTQDLLAFVRERVAAALPAGQAYAVALGAARIQAQRLDLLPNTLPYAVFAITREAAALDTQLVVTARLRVTASAGANGALDLTFPLHELVNDRVTLSYDAATPQDHRVALLWGGIDLTPSYLVKLRPQLHIAGRLRGSGTDELSPGSPAKFDISLAGPFGTHSFDQTVTVGAYHAIGIASGVLTRPAKSPAGNNEYEAAKILDGVAIAYVNDWKEGEDEFALLTGSAVMRPLPSILMVNNYLRADAVANVTFAASWRGVTMDAMTRVSEPIGPKRVDWMKLSALHGSGLEQLVFKRQFQVDSVSADRVLALAGGNVVLTAANAEAQLATLPHSAGIKDDIRNWTRQGYTVTTHGATFTKNIWTGAAWMVEDTASGAAGYFISGLLAGGATTEAAWILGFLADALAYPHGGEANNDPLSAARVELIPDADGQFGTVGKPLPRPFAVRVTDPQGRPVQGAEVFFVSTRGGGTFKDGTAVKTNAAGIAQASEFTLGLKTSEATVFLNQNSGDKYPSQAGQNFVEVFAAGRGAPVRAAEPFNAFAFADVPTTVIPRSFSGSGTATVKDQHGNPVSNVQVTMSADRAESSCEGGTPSPVAIGDTTICPKSPRFGDCGSSSHTMQTDSLGVAAFLVMMDIAGGGTYYANVNAAGKSVTMVFKNGIPCNTYGILMISGSVPIDGEGRAVAAARTGQLVNAPATFDVYFLKTTSIETKKVTNPDGSKECLVKPASTYSLMDVEPDKFEVEVSEGGLADPPVKDGNHYFSKIRVGFPGFNAITARVEWKTQKPKYDVDCNVTNEDFTARGALSSDSLGMYAIDARITSVKALDTPPEADPGTVHLDTGGRSKYPTLIEYAITPSTYPALLADVQLLSDGQVVNLFTGDSKQDFGTVRIERGYPFRETQRNEAVLVVNADSPYEIKSDPVAIPFKGGIIVAVRAEDDVPGVPNGVGLIGGGIAGVIQLKTDVDLANQKVCQIGSTYFFTLGKNASVSLKAYAVPDTVGGTQAAPVVLIDNLPYGKGEHGFPLIPTQFLPRLNGYVLELSVTAQDDPAQIEKASTRLKVVFDMQDALPVGQVLVKGVNVKSGRLTVPGQSIQVAGRGPQLAFRPVYSSGGTGAIGALGANWSHNYESGLKITPCGDVVVSTGDAGSIRFTPVAGGTFKPTRGYHGTLIANASDKSFDFYSKDGTQYHFAFSAAARSWVLATITDANNNVMTLTRDLATPEAPLSLVTDSSGRSLSFLYEARTVGPGLTKAMLVGVKGPDGLGLSFNYDEYGNLVRSAREGGADSVESYGYSVYAPLSFTHLMTGHSNAKGQVTSYVYELGSPIYSLGSGLGSLSVALPDGKVQSVTGADGGTTRFQYQVAAPGMTNPQITSISDPLGNTTVYTLNGYGSPLSIDTPAGTTRMAWAADDVVMTSKTDGNGVVATFNHDSEGNVLEERVSGGGVGYSIRQTWLVQAFPPFIKNRPQSRTDRNGKTTTFGYDARGNLLSENRPEGGSLSYSYAGNGDRVSATDGRGGSTRFSYDGNGNLERTTDPMGGAVETPRDARGRMASLQDQEGRTTTFRYNTLDQLTSQTDAEGGSRVMSYDALGNKLTEKDELGRTTGYSYDAMNRVTSITRPIGRKSFDYDAAGNKTAESDWSGNGTSYGYDNANRLTSRTEPLAKVTRYSYDAVGNVKTETDANGHAATHSYDGLNRRTRTVDAEGGMTAFDYDGNGNKTAMADAEGRVTAYDYDGLNRLTKSTANEGGVNAVTKYAYDDNGNVTSVTDPNGNVTAHDYDANNRKTRTTDAQSRATRFTYDKVGNKLSETNGRGFAKQYVYDGLNRVKTYQDEARHTSTYTYDKAGNRTGESLPNNNGLTHGYDALNRRTSTTDSLGLVSRRSYDADGNVLSETDANSRVTTHEYDALNRRTETHIPSAAGTRTLVFTYDKAGNLKTEKDANGHVTTHAYDDLNRRTSSSDSLGTRAAFTYDKVGNVRSEKDANGDTATHSYDGLNRRTKTTDSLGTVMEAVYDKAGNRTSGKDANGTETVTAYDTLNRPIKVTRAGVRLVTTEYDEVGNARFVTDANGNKVGYEYDGRNLKTSENKSLGAITRFTLDSMGDVLQVTDPEGRITKHTFDARRRLESTRNGASETTDFSYDGNGNRTGVMKPKGNKQTFEYDGSNRLTKVTTPAGSATLGYDLHGNLTSRKDANGHTTGYDYDARHRRTETTFADTRKERQTFDGNGNLKTLTDANGATTTYTYDIRDRETRKSYSASADELSSIETKHDGNGNVTETKESYASLTRTHTRSYDGFNRLERETDPWGDAITHTYDAQGNLKSTTAKGSTTTYGYDELNRRINVTTGAGAVTTAYDRTNLPVEVRYPNGVISTTVYDAALRIKEMATKRSGVELEKTVYTYDENGNRKDQVRAVAASGAIQADSENVSYTYDNDDWLTQTQTTRTLGNTSTTQTVAYVLDNAGNRTKETSTSGAANLNYVKNFTYDARDKITRIETIGTGTGLNAAGTTNYDYDPNGNLITRTRGVTQRTFVWNARDRLIEVKEPSLTLGKYKYNAEGFRDEIEGKRRTTWVGGFAYLDKDTATNGLLAKYETQANGRTPSLVTTPSGTDYLHADALGSSTLATGTDGATKATTHYDAFGNVETQGFTPNKFGYTGHEQDQETGLIYFKARHYDPELGRFISADPFEGEPGVAVSWNSYLYANGNPLIYIDRDGYDATPVFREGAEKLNELNDELAGRIKQYEKGWLGGGAAVAGGIAKFLVSGGEQVLRGGNLVANITSYATSKVLGNQDFADSSADQIGKSFDAIKAAGQTLASKEGLKKAGTAAAETVKQAVKGNPAAIASMVETLADPKNAGKKLGKQAVVTTLNKVENLTADAVKAAESGAQRAIAKAPDMQAAVTKVDGSVSGESSKLGIGTADTVNTKSAPAAISGSPDTPRPALGDNVVIKVDSAGTARINVGPHEVGPYREVGGHHPHQQAARGNNENYKARDALSMKDDGSFDHDAISKAQQSLNAQARRSGEAYDLKVEERIQREAMAKGKVSATDAETILKMSRENLESMGAVEPTRVPGSRRGK